MIRAVLYVFLLLTLTHCAHYADRVVKPRRFLEAGQYDAAIAELIKLAERKDNDELLYLFDLGTAYHLAGRYPQAIKTFLEAEKLATLVDYTSVSAEVGSVVLNDEIKPYKGEDFEKILVNVYLAIDYTMLHQWDDALVECRKVNHKLDLMISQGKLPYEQNAFAKYLSASLFDARQEYNDAFVDYRGTFKLAASFPYLGAPLLRVADRLHATQEFDTYRSDFPAVKQYRLGKGEGEIIVLLEQGKAPIKIPSPQFQLLPKFRHRFYSSDYAWVNDLGARARARTYTLYDIETTAIRELDNRIAAMAAKKIGGVVVKEVIAAEVARQTKSEALGFLTSLVLHATDSADLRSWTTLPARLQIARFTVPAGRRQISLDMVSESGFETKNVKRWDAVDVKPGETVFLNFRTPD